MKIPKGKKLKSAKAKIVTPARALTKKKSKKKKKNA